MKVPSLQKPISKKSRKTVIAISTFLYILGLTYGAYITNDAPYSIKFMLFGMLTLLYALAIIVTLLLVSAKENALIITERGIAYWPIVAEKWEDIDSYSWEEFKGLRRLPGPTVFSSCEGSTLRIINKGLFQRCLENRTSHSIFATYQILFTPEQIAATEAILNQHGIKKTE